MRLLLLLLLLPFKIVWRLTTPRRFPHGRPFEMRNPLIIDGDTLWHEGVKIRIWGIDAPEMSQRGGPAAKGQLARLCERRRIYVVPCDTDVYGRTVARLYYGRGDIGQQMVASGYAVACAQGYARDEKRATRRKAGLWAKGRISNPAAHRRRTMRAA